MHRYFSRAHICIVAVTCTLLVGPGCYTLTTFNSPQTTPDGEAALGAGMGAYVQTGEGNNVTMSAVPVAHGRIGLGDRWDAGAQLSPFVLFTDVKYQLVDQSVGVAADVGVSAGFPNLVGVYPALFVGTDRFYVGGRVAALSSTQDLDDDDVVVDEEFSSTLPGIMVGASLGNQVRIMPELNLYFPTNDRDPFFLPAIAFKYRFWDQD